MITDIDILLLKDIVDEFNKLWSTKTHDDEIIPFTIVFTGDITIINFFDIMIWNSEENKITYSKPLRSYLVKETNELLSKIKKFKIS